MFGLTKLEYSDAKIQITKFLINVAKNNGLVSYTDVSRSLIDIDIDAHSTAMFNLLGEVSESEHKMNRPLLSAIVVRQADGTAGDGFYKLARDLGRFNGKSDMDKLEFWTNEVKAVHIFWGAYSE